ncbi:hypothetical protein AURDEDRAFT_162281 [Auricularia subglabra TFB-10046 SS5]|nr:hypothetical protein AURDEDRAFT_162281 [Auricularia subglabra TFB-10046 SS5]
MVAPEVEVGIRGHDCRFLIWTSTLEAISPPVRTVADAAAVLERVHASHCDCGENTGFAENAWLTSLPTDVERDTAIEDYVPSEAERVPGNALLADLFPADTPGPHMHAQVMVGRDPDASTGPIVSPPTTSNFSDILSTPGTCYVDVAERIEPWYFSNRHKKMPIIRRPGGYGMTTFLSMCATTFNRFGGDPTLPRRRIWDKWHNREPRPVLALDFKELDFCKDGTLPDCDEMASRADSFMRETVSAFWACHLPEQEPVFDTSSCWSLPYHTAIKALSRQLDTQIFLTIDNYTVPFLSVGMSAYQTIEDVIWERVLGPLLDPYASVVFRGLIVGPALHGLRPFSGYRAFAAITEDLSDSAEYASAIGFTVSDAIDLARAVLGDKQGLFESVLAAHSLTLDDPAILSAGDVVRVLRMIQADDLLAPDCPLGRFPPGHCYDRMDMDDENTPGVYHSPSDPAFLEPMMPLHEQHGPDYAASGSPSSLVTGMNELQVVD